MNIVFWNCQGLRLKWKGLQNHLLENQIDILAQNKTFLEPKFKFHLPGYDNKNDRSVGTKTPFTLCRTSFIRIKIRSDRCRVYTRPKLSEQN